MATLKSNRTIVSEMIVNTIKTEEDCYTIKRTIYRAMSNGYVLVKSNMEHYVDGMLFDKFSGTWKRKSKMKAHLIGNENAIKDAMQAWQEQLIMKGIDAEISF